MVVQSGVYDGPIPAGGIVMIIIASVGVFVAFSTIICLFATTKKRSRVSDQLESISARNLAAPRRARARSANHVRTTLPMFPGLDDPNKRPPTYDEAMRNSIAVPTAAPTMNSPNENTPTREPTTAPEGTPPPAFDELSQITEVSEREEAEHSVSESTLTPTIVSSEATTVRAGDETAQCSGSSESEPHTSDFHHPLESDSSISMSLSTNEIRV